MSLVFQENGVFCYSDGKSACDGLGGTVKRLTALESLKRPYRNQILSAKAVFDFCNANIKGIKISFLQKKKLKIQEKFIANATKKYLPSQVLEVFTNLQQLTRIPLD